MSAIATNIGPSPIHFSVSPDDPDRWVKVSFKIGTVLIEDLLRINKPNKYVTVATSPTQLVDCTVSDAGVFNCSIGAFDLPVYFFLNEEGIIELQQEA